MGDKTIIAPSEVDADERLGSLLSKAEGLLVKPMFLLLDAVDLPYLFTTKGAVTQVSKHVIPLALETIKAKLVWGILLSG